MDQTYKEGKGWVSMEEGGYIKGGSGYVKSKKKEKKKNPMVYIKNIPLNKKQIIKGKIAKTRSKPIKRKGGGFTHSIFN